MTSSQEPSQARFLQKEKFIHSSQDFIAVLKLSIIGLEVDHESYKFFETTAVEFMSDVIDVYNHLVEAKGGSDKRGVQDMQRAMDIVKEGLANLVADSRDGASYDQFLVVLGEWKQIWKEQLSY